MLHHNMDAEMNTEYLTQSIISRSLHNALIRPRCLWCPSHGAKFKKRFNCVKMVMFHAIFVMIIKFSSLGLTMNSFIDLESGHGV